MRENVAEQDPNPDLQATIFHLPSSIRFANARVVKWQTRTFEGRMP